MPSDELDTVLVVGGGGREHALADAISQSDSVGRVVVTPGNYGTSRLQKTQNYRSLSKPEDYLEYCQELRPDLVVFGPELPLSDGVADVLRSTGIKVFGPNRNGAILEYDKAWAKDFMKDEEIPTADFDVFYTADEGLSFVERCPWKKIVIKRAGLAGGKGVYITEDKDDAKEVLERVMNSDKKSSQEDKDKFVFEEYLDGYEISVHVVCDGEKYAALPTSQDHKRRFEGDEGLNTGGMGAIAPVSVEDKALKNQIDEIISKTVKGLIKRKIKYIGVIYVGLMVTADGPKVLEYNCRFGDPETQVIVPLVPNFYQVLKSCAYENFNPHSVKVKENTSACVVCIVINCYPESGAPKGSKIPISGVEELGKRPDIQLFHAGVRDDDGPTVNGGRVLAVYAQRRSVEEAAQVAVNAASKVVFDTTDDKYKADFRRDIGFLTILRERRNKGKKLNYQNAGVSIEAGNDLVENIKEMVISDKSGEESVIGHFGALYKIKENFKDPVLVSGTDGVGTKLMVAQEYDKHSTIGQDLVAMCVNDIIVCGAKPLFFLDYFATGKLKNTVASQVIKGIADACDKTGCSLVGGETAELPGMYESGKYDLAGFAVGVAERENILPRKTEIEEGDILVGIPSSGLHSNGFSLVRKVVERLGLRLEDLAPYDPSTTLGDSLLTPTRLYTDVLPLIRMKEVVGASHITGGGLFENIKRILPENLCPKIDESWTLPNVFLWLLGNGISWEEMLRTFNLGIGIVVVLHPSRNQTETELLKKFNNMCPESFVIGKVIRSDRKLVCTDTVSKNVEKQLVKLKCRVSDCFKPMPEKRVAVLISGNGTNLQALIDHTTSGLSAAKICLVISNKPGVKGLSRASEAAIPNMVIDNKQYANRVTFDAAVTEVLEQYGIELICLAGFMRILSGDFINRWRGKCINIHPSLLPSFKGKDAQKQALNAGVKITGCSVHFVNEEVDCGSLIVQEAVPVLADDTEETLSERIREAEHKIYPKALELVARDEIKQKY